MSEFIQIVLNSFMSNGGLLFKSLWILNCYYWNHLNRAGIYGGYIASIIDAGIGTGVHKSSGDNICVTISLEIKFIGSSRVGDELTGHVKIDKITNSLVFASCKLKSKDKLIATASGVWKKTLNKFSK